VVDAEQHGGSTRQPRWRKTFCNMPLFFPYDLN
jgi:hypothetical protein